MRFQCVPVATVGHTSASSVLWAVSLAAGKVVTTCPEETAVCFWLAVRGSVCWRRIGIRIKLTLWANALSLRILLRHNTHYYVVKWLYHERMRYQSVSAVTQGATLRRYVIILWANSLSWRILLRHNTQHYVVKWLYHERMRYQSVSAVTQDATLRRYVIILWANSLSWRILLRHNT